jgi:hypothetical protein
MPVAGPDIIAALEALGIDSSNLNLAYVSVGPFGGLADALIKYVLQQIAKALTGPASLARWIRAAERSRPRQLGRIAGSHHAGGRPDCAAARRSGGPACWAGRRTGAEFGRDAAGPFDDPPVLSLKSR